MKLLFHKPGHHKNTHAISQMCLSIGWECEFTIHTDRLNRVDYDILILNSEFIPPERFPPSVKLIYGPQHFVFPKGPLVGPLRSELVSRACYNTLSEWVYKLFEETAPSMIMPKAALPFGIDVARFTPNSAIEKDNQCIVYIKHRVPTISNFIISFLKEKSISHIIYRYGHYKESDYIRDLQRSHYMIVIDAHESQGFALQEAMACDIPLLVCNASSMYDEVDDRGRQIYQHLKPKKLYATSVPYWSDKCGILFTDHTTLSEAFEEFIKKLNDNYYAPRQFILDTLSPDVCMRRILAYFKIDIK